MRTLALRGVLEGRLLGLRPLERLTDEALRRLRGGMCCVAVYVAPGGLVRLGIRAVAMDGRLGELVTIAVVLFVCFLTGYQLGTRCRPMCESDAVAWPRFEAMQEGADYGPAYRYAVRDPVFI